MNTFQFPQMRRKNDVLRSLQVLAGVVLTANSALAQVETQVETPDAQNNEARVSLRLQKMPLSQMLNLLGMQSDVHFRYAAIPDAQATLELENAPLDAALRNVLTTLGFTTRNAPPTVGNGAPKLREVWWLWRDDLANEAPDAATKPAPTWQMWNGAQPPHERWMKPPSPRGGEFSGTLNSHSGAPTGVPGVAPVGVQVRWRDSTKTEEEAWWAPPAIRFENGVLPGAQIGWPAKSDNLLAPRLRWPLWLREVPPRVQLVLETDRPATLWLNGARLLRGWSGVRRLELSPTLQVGANLLAIEWDTPAPNSAPEAGESSETKAPLQSPIFRYEWLVGS